MFAQENKLQYPAETCSLIITDMLLNNNMQYGGLIKKNTNFNFTYTITD
jgi:hypothetical protein